MSVVDRPAVPAAGSAAQPSDAGRQSQILPTTEFMGTRFAAVTTVGAVDRMMRLMRGEECGWVSTVNIAILMMMRSDVYLRDYVHRSAMIVADGQPIVWGARLLGDDIPERITGVDLIEELCARCEQEARSVYLLGGTGEVLDALERRLRLTFPDLRLKTADGYFGPAEAAERVRDIREFGTDLLVVGMGVPRQERFVRDHWDDLGVPVAIGVGGSLNVLAGALRRAPVWMQQYGLEWVYRLAQEPRRLLRRYAVTNTQFCLLYGREFIERKMPRRKPRPGADGRA